MSVIDTRYRVLEAIEDSPVPLTATQIAKMTGLAVTTVRYALRNQEHAGFVVRVSRHGSRPDEWVPAPVDVAGNVLAELTEDVRSMLDGLSPHDVPVWRRLEGLAGMIATLRRDIDGGYRDRVLRAIAAECLVWRTAIAESEDTSLVAGLMEIGA